jgi:hypothetical protein
VSALDRFILGDVVAVGWNPELAAKFPDADHWGCTQLMRQADSGIGWMPFDPPQCRGYHCPKCGVATNMMGHHHTTGRGCEASGEGAA